jgi:precorrin-6B methylase 2
VDAQFLIPFLGGFIAGIVFGALLVLWVLFKLMQKMARLGSEVTERERTQADSLKNAYMWNPRNPDGNPRGGD